MNSPTKSDAMRRASSGEATEWDVRRRHGSFFASFLRSLVILFVLFAVSDLALGAEEGGPGDDPSRDAVEWQPLGESSFFERASAAFIVPQGEIPLGAVVLVAGPPERMEALAQSDSWRDAADRAGWALALVAVQSVDDLTWRDESEASEWLAARAWARVSRETGEIDREDDSGQPLRRGAFLIGEGGDRLLSSVIGNRSRVDAWVAMDADRFPDLPETSGRRQDAPSGRAVSPGLLIGSRPSNRNHWEFFQELRKQDLRNRVAFLPGQGRGLDTRYLEEAGRAFLRSAFRASPEAGRWIHYESGVDLTAAELEENDEEVLAQYAWLPDAEMVGLWKTVTRDRPTEPDSIVRMFSRELRTPRFFERFEIHHNRIRPEPKAILVVAMDSDRPQRIFQDRAWVDFARRNDWSLMVLNVTNGRRVPSHDRATEWMERRLFRFLENSVYGQHPDLPLVVHGIGRASYWMQRLMVRRPERMAAWSSLGAPAFAALPPGQSLPPGLIVAPHPNTHFPSLFFLQDVRKADRSNRVCMLARGEPFARRGYVEHFVRRFLEGAVASRRSGDGFWLRYRDGERLTLSESRQGVDPADYVWFPNERVAGAWKLLSRIRPQIPFPTIERVTIETGVEEQPELNLFVRIPGRVAQKDGEDDEDAAVEGVLCFCTWQREDASLLNRLKRPDDPLVSFADRNDLAVITWNTAGLLPRGANIHTVDEAMERELSRKFDRIGKAWLEGVEELCRDHDLPDGGFLLHGVSRGSTYAHRLALRYPGKLLAVHTHIASHYEPPVEEASDVIWLVTTGEIDGGYRASREFFREARELGYPMLLKAGPSLGHSMRDDIERLSMEFYTHVLELRRQAGLRRQRAESGSDEAKLTAAQLFRDGLSSAPYFGDFINHGVYPKKKGDWVPEAQRILLPTEEIANAWGAEPEGEL